MIAKIRCEWQGEPVEATLEDDLTWHCPADPTLARTLNLRLAACDRSQARGRWWEAHAEAMAESLDGEVEFALAPEEPPGRVY